MLLYYLSANSRQICSKHKLYNIYIYIVATFSIREGVVDIPDGKPKWAGLNDQSDLIEDTDSPPELKTALKKKKKKKKWKREDNEGSYMCNLQYSQHHSTFFRFQPSGHLQQHSKENYCVC